VQYSLLPHRRERHFSMPLEMDFPLGEWLRARSKASRAAGVPFVIGVTGSVAVGKSTFALSLRAMLEDWREDPRVDIVATDGFLFDNQTLAAREISMRKGFPESYDVTALRTAVAAVKAGKRVAMPLYSHVTYDIDTENVQTIERPDILILDGLHLAQIDGPGKPRLIDALIYLDSEEADVERWFTDRLIPLMEEGIDDAKSFYHAFRAMTADERRAFAKRVWQEINLPNLRNHIVQDRAAADLVVRKAADHHILKVTEKRS
jgi:type I pantothenate kinase